MQPAPFEVIAAGQVYQFQTSFPPPSAAMRNERQVVPGHSRHDETAKLPPRANRTAHSRHCGTSRQPPATKAGRNVGPIRQQQWRFLCGHLAMRREFEPPLNWRLTLPASVIAGGFCFADFTNREPASCWGGGFSHFTIEPKRMNTIHECNRRHPQCHGRLPHQRAMTTAKRSS